ncbi:MAG: platelet-activating factor acetylhydrolase IB subunit [Planctomycetota bacterium]|jgi:beta-glucosidase
MKRLLYDLSVVFLGLFFLLSGCTSPQQIAFESVEGKTHSAVTPADRDCKRHRAFNSRVKQGNVDLIFIGDSITHSWEKNGKEVWSQYYGNRNAVNLGIGGDRTQHVLWRLANGNIQNISPKVAVLMIGTNNHPPRSTAEEITDGIISICKVLREKLPNTKILLLAIFPRGQQPNEMREELARASIMASVIADNKNIYYLDIGDKFLEPDGTISKEIMPDFLHLSPKGYQIWAEAIEPELVKLM